MRKASGWIPATAMVAALAGCSNNDPGFYAEGALTASIPGTNAGDPATETGFRFQQSTRVDPTLPAGRTSGPTGTCTVGPDGRAVRLTQIGGEPLGMRDVNITLPSWETADTAPRLGRIEVTIGQAVFAGEELRDTTTPSPCHFATTRNGSFDLQLTVQCTGLTSQTDPRRVDVNSNLTLTSCDGPETRR
jgi:hypothetical protein